MALRWARPHRLCLIINKLINNNIIMVFLIRKTLTDLFIYYYYYHIKLFTRYIVFCVRHFAQNDFKRFYKKFSVQPKNLHLPTYKEKTTFGSCFCFVFSQLIVCQFCCSSFFFFLLFWITVNQSLTHLGPQFSRWGPLKVNDPGFCQTPVWMLGGSRSAKKVGKHFLFLRRIILLFKKKICLWSFRFVC